MSSLCPITPMQMQVLEAVAALETDPLIEGRPYDAVIASRGRTLFGQDWSPGKTAQLSDPFSWLYPTLNRLLGTLRKKGYLDRYGESSGAGGWALTPFARDLLGLPPA